MRYGLLTMVILCVPANMVVAHFVHDYSATLIIALVIGIIFGIIAAEIDG